MQQNIRDQIDWEQPFPAEEYAERRAKVQAALARDGLSGILVTEPRNIYYLTGHDHIWQYKQGLTALFLETQDGERLFIDSASHKVIVSTTPEIQDVIYYPRGKAMDHTKLIADAIVSRGWVHGTIALQPWGYGPHPDLVRAIGERLEAAGANVVDRSYLVEDVRLVKSPREQVLTRQAASIANHALGVARDAIRPGMRETELEAVLCHELMINGSGYPGIRTMVGSGPRSGAHHSAATHRTIKSGDIVHVDFCSSLHRYHANLSRSFAVGEVDPRWHDLMDRSAGCMDSIVAAVTPGDPMSRIQEVADAFIAASGIDEDWVWLVGGYVLGIAFPPDWVHRNRPRPSEDAPDPVLEPGVVLNYENQYDVFEGWPGGTGVGYIDTFMMTDTGFELLTTLPRNLVVVGN